MSAWEPAQPRCRHARRSVLRGLGLFVLAPMFLGSLRARDWSSAETLLFAGLDRHHLAQMGKAVPRELGAGDHADLVAGALSDIGLDAGAISNLDARAIAKRRAEAIREDFDRGKTVKVDGWLLARTEVRLAALAACSVT